MNRPPVLRLLGSLAVLLAIVGCLHWLARFDLRGPTGLSRAELSLWADDLVVVVATICRWLALAAGWYLIVVVIAVGALGVPNEHSGWRRLVPTPLVGAIGAALGATAVILPAAAHLHEASPAHPAPASATVLHLQSVIPLTLTPEATTGPTQLPETHPMTGAGPAESAVPDTTAATVESTLVRTGDSFWSLAEEHLEDEWGRRDLTDSEITPYWRELVEANRAELTDPANPDLLLPGQRLRFPPTPDGPGSD